MTEISVKVDVLKGMFRIVPHENDVKLYVARGTNYHPLEFEAGSLGHAVDVFLQSVHLLKPTEEYKQKQKARSELSRQIWEKTKANKKKVSKDKPAAA